MQTNQFEEVEFDTITHILKDKTPLIVTATQTETKALHGYLMPLDGFSSILKITEKNATYYVGRFGNFIVTHVQCGSMGSSTSSGSIITIGNAINLIEPKFVLMVGIAFGIDRKEQKIGDVLVSETIMPYEIQRIGTDKIVSRNVKPEASNTLKNIFKNTLDWSHTLSNEKTAKLTFGDVLSGDKLIDNIDFRDQLKATFETAIGGEMEGTGLYAACQDKKVDWILIKAICDFADGKKKRNKDENQQIAASSAVNFCLHVFKQKYVFVGLGVNIEGQSKKEDKNKSQNAHNTEGGQTINSNGSTKNQFIINHVNGNIIIGEDGKIVSSSESKKKN